MAATATFYGLLRSPRVPRGATLAVTLAVVLALPWIVPASARAVRFVFALHCLMAALKIYDLGSARAPLPPPRRFVEFFLNPTVLVERKLDAERRPSAVESRALAMRGLVMGAIGGAAFAGIQALHFERASFVVEHVAKLVAMYVGLIGAIDVVVALWRLFVGRARHPMGNIFTARTPAEFWRRYNRTVGQFFYEDLFALGGGRRHPVRATLFVFAFSSVIHEYVFGIAIGAVQGWQTAFFMLQGLGVAATLRARPRGATAVVATLATATFNIASSVLFFVSIDQLLPFWSAPPFRP